VDVIVRSARPIQRTTRTRVAEFAPHHHHRARADQAVERRTAESGFHLCGGVIHALATSLVLISEIDAENRTEPEPDAQSSGPVHKVARNLSSRQPPGGLKVCQCRARESLSHGSSPAITQSFSAPTRITISVLVLR
jgi:hypothetical protein